MKTQKNWIYLDCGRRPNLHRWNLIFEIRKSISMHQLLVVELILQNLSSDVFFSSILPRCYSIWDGQLRFCNVAW
ncbi:hypothetical protein RDI58_014835 [Solanum bulbocastanum]|uniref:Uncharacterized protein n=1 Tax=Solanum bulbocastanum TaxID=147425 RepID=A0AAN8YAY4_SOLBU